MDGMIESVGIRKKNFLSTETTFCKEIGKWKNFLFQSGLYLPENFSDHIPDFTVLLKKENSIIATGSLVGNILQYFAVLPHYRGEDLTGKLITLLREEAFQQGKEHLFLYTAPEKRTIFESLLFTEVATADGVTLLETPGGSVKSFIRQQRAEVPMAVREKESGAIVLKADPFTLGHRYLIEKALKESSHLHLFLVSEEGGMFSYADRRKMLEAGTHDLSNVYIHPTGPYLVSMATFPRYFLRAKQDGVEAQCGLDIEVFGRYFIPAFHITRRFVGTEPFSAVTASYNEALATGLPRFGTALITLPRLCVSMTADTANRAAREVFVSAKTVRTALRAGNTDVLRAFLPESTLALLSCT